MKRVTGQVWANEDMIIFLRSPNQMVLYCRLVRQRESWSGKRGGFSGQMSLWSRFTVQQQQVGIPVLVGRYSNQHVRKTHKFAFWRRVNLHHSGTAGSINTLPRQDTQARNQSEITDVEQSVTRHSWDNDVIQKKTIQKSYYINNT